PLFVPVPLDRKRLRKRGYNQALLMAKALARQTKGDVALDMIARVKPTDSTRGLGPAARRRAAQGAFAPDRKLSEKRPVILVDDVMTTGATIEAASRALKKAGASRVDVLVYARSLSTGV
ncbi:MAG: phosphoribosyltransferase family protein, partial [Pacificimonas sp.]